MLRQEALHPLKGQGVPQTFHFKGSTAGGHGGQELGDKKTLESVYGHFNTQTGLGRLPLLSSQFSWTSRVVRGSESYSMLLLFTTGLRMLSRQDKNTGEPTIGISVHNKW